MHPSFTNQAFIDPTASGQPHTLDEWKVANPNTTVGQVEVASSGLYVFYSNLYAPAAVTYKSLSELPNG